ncbi:DCC1-like thiol-disulfide oxidoreductase family protein [Bacillus cereus]|uniref:DCC1-like thiol-disulfide oxidoreductase family protein n=2 Tax=Bacillus TaxID=1386 RepID=UPI001E3D783D|nr:DCC1-like thiol-disulfide oxidoreductase family protein [Bacillus cereus]
MCKNVVTKLKKGDTFNLLMFKSFREYSNSKAEIGIPLTTLEKRMHSRKLKEEKYVSGIDSIIQICKRVPIMWGILIFLYLGKFMGIDQRTYDFIAKRRMIVPVGHCENNICERKL